MLGYNCPVCGGGISIAKHRERRTCPHCKASIETQQYIREKKNREAGDAQ